MTCQANHTGEQAILQLAEEAIHSENPFIFSDVGAFLVPNMKTQKVSEVEHLSHVFSTGFSSYSVHILEKHAGKTLRLIAAGPLLGSYIL